MNTFLSTHFKVHLGGRAFVQRNYGFSFFFRVYCVLFSYIHLLLTLLSSDDISLFFPSQHKSYSSVFLAYFSYSRINNRNVPLSLYVPLSGSLWRPAFLTTDSISFFAVVFVLFQAHTPTLPTRKMNLQTQPVWRSEHSVTTLSEP
jgi:hypothetical protein